MMNKKEIRWRQRFENFEQAYALLDNHIDADTSDELAAPVLSSFLKWHSNWPGNS